MDFYVWYQNSGGPKSPAGVADYFGSHLQESQEVGPLARHPGYLSKEGEVRPLALNPDLWAEVGWDPQMEPMPPRQLLISLPMGFDLEGNLIGQSRGLYRAPKESMITLPSELSMALRDDPDLAIQLLEKAVRAHVEDMELEAVRVRTGGGQREWHRARTLTLAYIHAENRGSEVHFHAHVLTFSLAKDEQGAWRTFDNGRQVSRMSKPNGSRAKVTDAVIKEAALHGIKLFLDRGTVSLNPGKAHGATVVLESGQVIEAGSIPRQRRVEILAAKELRRELGAPPLTPRELEKVRRHSGALPSDLEGIKRPELLICKLNALKLLDPEGRILPPGELNAAITRMEELMARAQTSVLTLSSATKTQATAAAEIIHGKRLALAKQVPGISVDGSLRSARIRWTKDYTRILGMVIEAGSVGLSPEGIEKRDRDLLSKLHSARHLIGVKSKGRMTYFPTELGILKFSEVQDRILAASQQRYGGICLPPERTPPTSRRTRQEQTPTATHASSLAVNRQSGRDLKMERSAPKAINADKAHNHTR